MKLDGNIEHCLVLSKTFWFIKFVLFTISGSRSPEFQAHESNLEVPRYEPRLSVSKAGDDVPLTST